MAADPEDLPFFHPKHTPSVAPVVQAPREPLWELHVAHVTWSAELILRGESYEWKARIVRDGEFFMSQRFVLREHASRWADEQRRDLERGWIDE